MSIELARELWKETRNFIHDEHDKKEGAEAVTAVLMEYYDAEEIADAFKFDKNVINSIADYLGDDLDDEYYDEED